MRSSATAAARGYFHNLPHEDVMAKVYQSRVDMMRGAAIEGSEKIKRLKNDIEQIVNLDKSSKQGLGAMSNSNSNSSNNITGVSSSNVYKAMDTSTLVKAIDNNKAEKITKLFGNYLAEFSAESDHRKSMFVCDGSVPVPGAKRVYIRAITNDPLSASFFSSMLHIKSGEKLINGPSVIIMHINDGDDNQYAYKDDEGKHNICLLSPYQGIDKIRRILSFGRYPFPSLLEATSNSLQPIESVLGKRVIIRSNIYRSPIGNLTAVIAARVNKPDPSSSSSNLSSTSINNKNELDQPSKMKMIRSLIPSLGNRLEAHQYVAWGSAGAYRLWGVYLRNWFDPSSILDHLLIEKSKEAEKGMDPSKNLIKDQDLDGEIYTGRYHIQRSSNSSTFLGLPTRAIIINENIAGMDLSNVSKRIVKNQKDIVAELNQLRSAITVSDSVNDNDWNSFVSSFNSSRQEVVLLGL